MIARHVRSILLLVLIAGIFGAGYYLYTKGRAWQDAQSGEYALETITAGENATTTGVAASSTSTTPTVEVSLYYYNPALDADSTGNVLCSEKGLSPVVRTISKTMTPITDTIKLLLRGDLTEGERASGLTTEFPLPGVSLAGASLVDGVLTLTFDDPNARTSGGSCRARVLWSQVRATALQFPEVKEVRFMPEYLFQP